MISPGDVDVEEVLLSEAVDVLRGDGATNDGDDDTGVVGGMGERYEDPEKEEATDENCDFCVCECLISRRVFDLTDGNICQQCGL